MFRIDNIGFILNEFANAVKEKRYKKVNYDTWRKLGQETDRENFINCYFHKENREITAYGEETYHFSAIDGSFGSFLYDKYLTKKSENNKKEEKEIKEMKVNSMFKFDFGPVSDGSVRMSPCGMAMMNSENQWVSYDVANDQIVNVDGLTFDIHGMLFKMPVAIKDVSIGDMILHQGRYVYVIDFPSDSNGIVVIDIEQGENRVVRPTTNLFGFNFVTKVISMFNTSGFAGAPSADQPFGNIFPLIMMSQMGEGNMFGDMDMGQFMMISMFAGGGNPFAGMFAAAPTHECKCQDRGCSCQNDSDYKTPSSAN